MLTSIGNIIITVYKNIAHAKQAEITLKMKTEFQQQ